MNASSRWCALIICASAVTAIALRSSPVSRAAIGVSPPPIVMDGPTPIPPLEGDAVAITAEKIRAVIASWPSPYGIPQADLGEVAYTIARVASDESDAKTAASLLMSLGFFEGAHFAKYVDDGTCNRLQTKRVLVDGRRQTVVARQLSDEERALLAYGNCDHGDAYSLWQVHARDGMPAAALFDRDYAARAALTIARRDMTLCAYTGEAANPKSSCPLAKERLAFAARARAALER
jgi:hypothetical protein